MKYRLLVDLEVLDLMAALRPAQRRRLRKRFEEIRDAPHRWVEVEERDAVGRPIGITLCGDFAVKFWDDPGDAHVKILSVVPADR